MIGFTLRQGDYVKTKGLTPQQLEQIADKFIEAGCGKGEYDLIKDYYRNLTYMGWDEFGKLYFSGDVDSYGDITRKLTYEQVLNLSYSSEVFPNTDIELGSHSELQNAIDATVYLTLDAMGYTKITLNNHLDSLLKRQRDLFAAEDLYDAESL